MSLTKSIASTIDLVFSDPRLSDFSTVEAKDGTSFCRYYRKTDNCEQEIAVYRDKRWTKSGGKIYIELYCLPNEIQQALGGCSQSWLTPDHSKPLISFQYRTSKGAQDTEYNVTSVDDTKILGDWLLNFIVSSGLPWLDNFQSTENITSYLKHEGLLIQLAKWHIHLGNKVAARDSFKAYMLTLPREIERTLNEMQSIGLITEVNYKLLLKASMQQEATYRDKVEKWYVDSNI